jgi:mitochondrial fission protein ELM1
MLSQMRGLAQAVGTEFEPHVTRLRWPWSWLPPSLVPRTPSVILEPGPLLNTQPPALLISCGRHSVAPAIWLKRRFGSQMLSVFVQDPLVDTRNFDLVVAPQHDHVRGLNVIQTQGALHHVSGAALATARETALARQLAERGRPLVTVLLGGPNRYFGFAAADMSILVSKLHRLASTARARLLIVCSRRTPLAVRRQFDDEFGPEHFVWDTQPPNPYLAALAVADAIVVTGDSVSMASEAAATGRPVFVAHLRERLPAKRFRRFHAAFHRSGITRPFEGRLETWSYTPPDDTAVVAAAIKHRMG